MTKNVSIYNQSTSKVDEKYLEASQQLQLDKQTYGSDYIHLYVDNIEGDWLENWDWEDDLTDYIDAFYHHCEQGNYQLAFDTLKAGDDLLKKLENREKCLELYSYLVKMLNLQNTKKEKKRNEEILNQAKQRILTLKIVKLCMGRKDHRRRNRRNHGYSIISSSISKIKLSKI
jgi:hypothetical protein